MDQCWPKCCSWLTLVFGWEMPSSTHDTDVFWSPTSTTHAYPRPAPNVAATWSYNSIDYNPNGSSEMMCHAPALENNFQIPFCSVAMSSAPSDGRDCKCLAQLALLCTNANLWNAKQRWDIQLQPKINCKCTHFNGMPRWTSNTNSQITCKSVMMADNEPPMPPCKFNSPRRIGKCMLKSSCGFILMISSPMITSVPVASKYGEMVTSSISAVDRRLNAAICCGGVAFRRRPSDCKHDWSVWDICNRLSSISCTCSLFGCKNQTQNS